MEKARGKPRKFASKEELIDLFQNFCEEISEKGYLVVPTQTEFSRWLSYHYADTDRRTIYNYLNKYFPDIKGMFEQIQSDTVAAGAMLGKYNSTMSIFALRNWCDWGDGKQEISATVTKTSEIAVSSTILKALLDDNTQKGD